MKALFLYRPDSEFARVVEEYAHDFEKVKGKPIELVDLNTREGADMARLYDMMSNPVLMLIREDGQLMNSWQGSQFPTKDEVAGYLL